MRNKTLNEFKYSIFRSEVAFEFAVAQHRLQHGFWRIYLQVEQQHANVFEAAAWPVVAHQFHDTVMPFISPDFLEKRNDVLFFPLKDLQKLRAVKQQNAGNV